MGQSKGQSTKKSTRNYSPDACYIKVYEIVYWKLATSINAFQTDATSSRTLVVSTFYSFWLNEFRWNRNKHRNKL